MLGTAAGVLALVLLQNNWRAALVTSFIFAIICLSLVVVTGYAGQVSLAQLTLAGVAGFLLATMTTEWSIPFPIAPILAALGATVVGVVVGLPGDPRPRTLRRRGDARHGLRRAGRVVPQLRLRPAEGRDISGPKFFGLDLRSRVGTDYPRIQFCLVVLGVLVIVAVSVALLRRSRLGSAMLAVRANERSAAGAGINVVRVKILAFAIAAFIAGLGGAMLGYKQGNLTFDPFDVLIGIGVFATAYLAGITSVSGGILAGMLAAGGIVYYATTQWLDLGDWYGTITGVRPRAHGRAQPGRHRRAVPRHAREDADPPRHHARACADADSGERRRRRAAGRLRIRRCSRSTTSASRTAASSRSTT